MRNTRKMSDHMTQVNNALKELLDGKIKQYVFITSPRMMNEQIDRAYGALSSMGYATLASRSLGEISLGKNDKVREFGFRITYMGLTDGEGLLQRLRGISAHVVVLEEAEVGQVLNADQRQMLAAEISIINSKYEIQVG